MHAIQIHLIYFEDYNEAELIGIVKNQPIRCLQSPSKDWIGRGHSIYHAYY